MRLNSLPPATCALLLLALILPARAAFPEPDKLPAHPGLPDPLVMLNGDKVATRAQWETKRRPELKPLFEHYMYGKMPAAPARVEAKVEREDRKALGGKATLREVTLTVGPPEAPKIHLLLVVPNARPGPVPAFVGMNFCGNHALVNDPNVRIPTAWMYNGPGVVGNKATAAGRGKQIDVWALEQAIDRGYAVATFYNGDVDPDVREVRGGLRPFLGPKGEAGPHDTATIMAWAWGLSRVVDYLLTVKEIDSKRIAVVGHSRLGKAAIVAAAFDERIALAIPHQAGCGGTAPSRGKVGESVKRINTSFPHWFNGAFKKFNDQPERLPFDQNCLVALVAPRPVLFSNAVEDTWANPDGQFEVLKAADPVYRFLGAGGLEAKKVPPINEGSAGTLGYYVRPGKHSMTKGDWKVFLDFADRHFRKPAPRGEVPPKRRLLLVGQGPDGHPPATHEYLAGLGVLAACLKKVPGLEVMTVRADGAWAEGPELLDRSDGVVLFLAEGARWVGHEPKRRAALGRLAKRGGGVVVLHWAMGTREARPIEGALEIMGGCHGGPDRKYKVVETDVKVAEGKHPVTEGVRDFRVKDEFYYGLKFTAAAGLVPLLRVRIDGRDETVAWGWQRPDGGRSFGFSGLHFHANWRREEYRRLVAQGALWALKLPVPEGGLRVEVGEGVLSAR